MFYKLQEQILIFPKYFLAFLFRGSENRTVIENRVLIAPGTQKRSGRPLPFYFRI
jgi:hypothetical protein